MDEPEAIEYEELLKRAGDMNRYQLMYQYFVRLFVAFCAANTVAVVFIAGINDDHWCDLSNYRTAFPNTTEAELMKMSRPFENGKYSSCEQYALGRNSSIEGKAQTCNKWQYSDSPFDSTVGMEWNLVCGNKWQYELGRSLFMVGFIIGCLINGPISDRFGRRVAYLSSITGSLIINILLIFSPNVIYFTILRVILAIFTIGIFTTSHLYGIEIVGKNWRVEMNQIGMTTWSVGMIWIGIMAYLIRDSQTLQIAFTIPQAVVVIYYIFITESPRWLYVKGRNEEGDKIMRRIARVNGKTLPTNFKVIMHQDTEGKQHTPLSLLRTKNMRKRSLILFVHWFTSSLIYYGISLNTASLPGDRYANFIYVALVDVPTYVMVVVLFRYGGRKIPIMVMYSLCGLALIVSAFSYNWPTWISISLVLTGKFFANCVFSFNYIYTMEVMPTVCRNTGLATCSLWARLGSVLEPLILITGKTATPLIFGGLSVICALLTVFLPETSGEDLPETMEDGENFPMKKSAQTEMFTTSTKI